jgi:heme/copper-type cytochrome/quinol oxidase subunit 1
MSSAGPAVPPSVPSRRPPLWWVVLAALGGVLVLGGALVVVLHPAETTFGWFAYTPLSDESFPAMTPVTPEATAGWAGVVAGLVLWAFCTGWLVGRRRRDPRR